MPVAAIDATAPCADLSDVLTPLDDRIFVAVTEEELKRHGMLWRVDRPKDKFARQFRGTVVAVGPGLPHKTGRFPPQLKVGDEVIFKGWHWLDVEVNGRKLKMMRERDIDVKVCD